MLSYLLEKVMKEEKMTEDEVVKIQETIAILDKYDISSKSVYVTDEGSVQYEATIEYETLYNVYAFDNLNAVELNHIAEKFKNIPICLPFIYTAENINELFTSDTSEQSDIELSEKGIERIKVFTVCNI